MPLKDLTIDKSKATEGIIESVIKPFIRYDVKSKSVFFLLEAEELSNIKKVLVYLVSLIGWKFVTEEPIPWEVKPIKIEKVTGIKGGTLRPLLKDLKESKIVVVKNGNYSVPDYNIGKVKNIIEGETLPPVKSVAKGKKTKGNQKSPTKSASQKTQKQEFDELVNTDWFSTKRTQGDVKERFHELGQMIPSSSLPYYLLKAIREGKLKRKKETVKGKNVWVYSKK